MVLVDTSIWIEVFKRPAGIELSSIADLDEIATCLPVAQEVLQGIRDESAFHVAREAMFSFPLIETPMAESLYMEAVALYRSARRQGITVRSSIDCLIAACALRHGLTVLHHDRDFKALARVSALKQRAF
ncbi:MAG TPA: PIN domain-containing protein [Vicinamibacteria bacterium]|nr:PIN domain-containing protein [Vicinamibacteria bacterium]